jgi:hypothetical protein
MTEMKTTQVLNHAQNRKDIHDLRNGQQRFSDAMADGFEKVSKAIVDAITPIRQDVFNLQMWRSKTTGYVIGMSVLAAFIFKVVETGLTHAGVK